MDIEPILEELTRLRENNIVSVNARLIAVIAKMLAFDITPVYSSVTPSNATGSDRIADLVCVHDGGLYISGTGFSNYISKSTWPTSLPYTTIDFTKYILKSSVLSTNSIIQSIATNGLDKIKDEMKKIQIDIKNDINSG